MAEKRRNDRGGEVRTDRGGHFGSLSQAWPLHDLVPDDARHG